MYRVKIYSRIIVVRLFYVESTQIFALQETNLSCVRFAEEVLLTAQLSDLMRRYTPRSTLSGEGHGFRYQFYVCVLLALQCVKKIVTHKGYLK